MAKSLNEVQVVKSLKVPQALRSLKLETMIVYAVVVLTAFAAGGFLLRYSAKGSHAPNAGRPGVPRPGPETQSSATPQVGQPETQNTVSPATPRLKHKPADRSVTRRSGPAQDTVKRGTYPIGRLILSDSTMLITLDWIQVTADDKLTAHIVYQNITQNSMPYTCQGYEDPAIDTLALANGKTIRSEKTYCSTHPNTSWTVKANAKFTSFATFTIPKNAPEPITFNWYPDYIDSAGESISGSVSDITL